MTGGRGRIGAIAAGAALALAVVMPSAGRQSIPPDRPALLVEGPCDAIGGTVATLTDATFPEGQRSGATDAIVAETSFTRLPLSLDDILAAPHAVAVLAGPGDASLLSCGEIGGVEDELGALIIGLREESGSGYAGIAFIAPDAETGGASISLFVAPDFDPDASPTATPLPTATATPYGPSTVVIGSDGAPLTVYLPTPPPTATAI
ncbi:MAG: hypothetical protein ACKOWF_15520, partial [Chloroflexota bacterium]